MDASFCLISCNIRFSTTDDGLNKWSNRVEFLSNLLSSYTPLILSTQEGRQPQIQELSQHLKSLKLVDQHREWIDERMYPCIFVDNSRVEVINSGDFWLSETPDVSGSLSFDSMFPRLCTWTKLVIQNQRILVANTHLDHVQDSTRLKQMKVLIQELSKIKSDSESLVIMGDFNCSPQSEVRQELMKHFPDLVDHWNLPEESSHHPFTGHNSEGARIDWILHNLKSSQTIIKLDKTHKDGIWPSDHFPVICRINF